MTQDAVTPPGLTEDVCRICGHAGGEVFRAREMMFGLREEFAYFQCPSCRCLQIRDIPPDLGRHYPENYYSLNAPLVQPVLLDRWRWRWEGRLRRSLLNFGHGRRSRIFQWMRRTNTDFGSAILDVGCGRGKLLNELSLFGFRDLTGADPFVAEELRYASGVVVHKCELSALERRFDLIMMHHTFEHVPDPLETMLAARERLQPGRFLLLRVPVTDCHAWRKYGVHWFALDAPRHLYLHTEKSIRWLAEHTGLQLAGVEWDSGAHQFWGSEQYLNDIPHHSPRSHNEDPRGSMFSRADVRHFEKESRRLNAAGQGDAACFYLQRS
ncbi:MAG TPA: class I SAM-dependent methyltransferase [Polyangiaceae bacterium]|nr:class I SAM-dependent methyltransferase [Polyangiaceae bacterium]